MSSNKHRNRPRKRDYDPISDKYTLSPAELANLTIGSAANAQVGAANASRVHKLACSGRSAADIMLITGLSRATVYRAMRRALDVAPQDELVWPTRAHTPTRAPASTQAPDAERDPLLM